jgi:hypothetical protein
MDSLCNASNLNQQIRKQKFQFPHDITTSNIELRLALEETDIFPNNYHIKFSKAGMKI